MIPASNLLSPVARLAGAVAALLLTSAALAQEPPVDAPSDAGDAPADAVVDLGDADSDVALAIPSDANSCLFCHRFPGLGRVDHETGEVHLYFVSERYNVHREGPHASLSCTQCHEAGPLEKVPHEEPQPVSCTQTCHLEASDGSAIRFAHDAIDEQLVGSVHDPATMADIAFTEARLDEGQSACLYCHDQPLYRDLDELALTHRGVSATTRCESCHDEALPVDVTYYLRHVVSRLDSQRPVKESAQVCATCHSDPAVMEQYGLHDAVTSYFDSFHGKAALLGSDETATCVDCHRTETGGVHHMRDDEDPESLTHVDNTQVTCRTSGCHVDAAPEISAAAVHMRTTPSHSGPEYWLMAGFIVFILIDMVVDFGHVLLELLNAVFRRHHAEHAQLVSLARKVMSDPRGRVLLQRMTPIERLQHWALVITFTALVVTGLPLKFAEHDFSRITVDVLGGIGMTRWFHRVAGVAMAVAFGWHLIYVGVALVRDVRRRRAENPARNVLVHTVLSIYESPMMVRPEDLTNFVKLYLHLLGLRKERPVHGRFHFSQKFEYWAVFWGMIVIGLSGAVLWANAWISDYIGGRALSFSVIIHSNEAFLAIMYIVVVHFFAVIFSPTVFPLSRGALTGVMPVNEIAEAHSGYLRKVAADLGITADPVHPHHGPKHLLKSALMRVYSAAMFVALGSLSFVAMSYLLTQLLGRPPAVDIDQLPLRLDRDTLALGTEAVGTGPGGARQARYQRGPLNHFHVIPPWYAPDAGNTCAGGGCHEALPHGERKEDRAFLNMHSTFVDCVVCHQETQPDAAQLGWVTLDARRTPADPPAVLRLTAAMDAPLSTDPETRRQQDETARELLAQAVEESGGDPELVQWRIGLESAIVDGPVYAARYEAIRRGLYLHGHGEFGAKIGLTSGAPWAPTSAIRDAAARLRAESDTLDKATRQALVAASHPGLRRPEVQCTTCHADEPDAIRFEDLGYSETRARSLRSNTIVRQSEAVERQEVFYLPRLDVPPPVAPETTDPSDEASP